MTNNHPLKNGVEVGSYWPYATAPAFVYRSGPWALLMGGGGDVVLWPTRGRRPADLGVLIPVIQGKKEELERALTVFCRRGYETLPQLIHQDGTVWIFNWRSYTLAQVAIASQVFGAYLDGDATRARAVGQAFQDQIDAASRLDTGTADR